MRRHQNQEYSKSEHCGQDERRATRLRAARACRFPDDRRSSTPYRGSPRRGIEIRRGRRPPRQRHRNTAGRAWPLPLCQTRSQTVQASARCQVTRAPRAAAHQNSTRSQLSAHRPRYKPKQTVRRSAHAHTHKYRMIVRQKKQKKKKNRTLHARCLATPLAQGVKQPPCVRVQAVHAARCPDVEKVVGNGIDGARRERDLGAREGAVEHAAPPPSMVRAARPAKGRVHGRRTVRTEKGPPKFVGARGTAGRRAHSIGIVAPRSGPRDPRKSAAQVEHQKARDT
jgi:hypothetical protein